MLLLFKGGPMLVNKNKHDQVSQITTCAMDFLPVKVSSTGYACKAA